MVFLHKSNHFSDEVEIYRCLILGESLLEGSVEKTAAEESMNKAIEHLEHGLKLCDHNKDQHVNMI